VVARYFWSGGFGGSIDSESTQRALVPRNQCVWVNELVSFSPPNRFAASVARSDRPRSQKPGQRCTLVRVTLPVGKRAITEWELKQKGGAYREWHIPADFLNRIGATVKVVPDTEARIAAVQQELCKAFSEGNKERASLLRAKLLALADVTPACHTEHGRT